jgi:RNA polymerase sigma factor (sigma-70 family)
MQTEEFQRIYSGQFDRVYRYALSLTGSPSCAEEIAQEAFLRLCRNGLEGGKIENPQAWLIRVARNLAMEQFRERSREPTHVNESAFTNPERLLYADEIRHRILAALARLPSTQKECITLREYANWATGFVLDIVALGQRHKGELGSGSQCSKMSAILGMPRCQGIQRNYRTG